MSALSQTRRDSRNGRPVPPFLARFKFAARPVSYPSPIPCRGIIHRAGWEGRPTSRTEPGVRSDPDLLLFHPGPAAAGGGVVPRFRGRGAFGHFHFAPAIAFRTAIGCTFFQHISSPPFLVAAGVPDVPSVANESRALPSSVRANFSSAGRKENESACASRDEDGIAVRLGHIPAQVCARSCSVN